MAESSQADDKLEPIFHQLTMEDNSLQTTQIESLCVNCEEQGETRLLLTRIPFFKEVIVSSFTCDHCGYHNAELYPGGVVQNQGVTYKLQVKTKKDLNRQVVQTSYATIKIPVLELEAPPSKGLLTTVEGVLDRVVEGLQQDQVLRRIQHPDLATKLEEFCKRLLELKDMEQPFELILDDPSGNSFLENPYAPNKDLDLHIHHYKRSRDQDVALGLADPDADSQSEEATADPSEQIPQKDEVLEFKTNCNNCRAPCPTRMKLVEIPHFKEVVIMSTVCEVCGARDSEVKSSGGIEPKGQRISLRLTDPSDLSRDVLKSETSSINIPELGFESEMGTLGGKFTTVEGLLINIRDQLKSNNPFFHGDSSQSDMAEKLSQFCNKLDEIISGKRLNITIVLDDPAGNSYMQNTYAPEEDPEMKIEDYERTYENNEDLGLNDMKTENYES